MCNGIDFVNRIDNILEENGKSRKDFCESIGINPSTMATWKTRNILPPVETIEKISSEIHVSIEWLLTGSAYKTGDFERGILARKSIRNRIYKKLEEHIGRNADNATEHATFFSNMSDITYEILLNWSKGYINLETYILEDIAYSLGTSLDYLVSELDTSEDSLLEKNDQRILDTANRNLNDLFCLDNLTGDRKQAAHIMLNQFMKLEHLEYVEKNNKDNK